jgi:hypothetical protein
VDRRARHRHGIDRTRQALAEWRRRELQRQVPRRVSEPRMVSFARRGEGSDRRMAATLQRGTSAFEPRLSHAERVRGSRSKSSAPPCNGPGRCGMWGLRAPARCSTVPAGTNAASKGSRLKLTMVRRIWAGQSSCLGGGAARRNPMRRILSGCCASAADSHAAAQSSSSDRAEPARTKCDLSGPPFRQSIGRAA